MMNPFKKFTARPQKATKIARYIYCEELYKLGYGFPLWIPEPARFRDGSSHHVLVGDVGVITQDGGFGQLFNALQDPNEVENSETEYPEQYSKLELSPSRIQVTDQYLVQGPHQKIASSGTSMQGNADVNAMPGSSGGGFRFEYSKCRQKVALLVLRPRGELEVTLQLEAVKLYCIQNGKSWYDLAKSQGFSVDAGIVLVHGTVKTATWALAAWTEEQAQRGLGISLSATQYASAQVSLHDAWQESEVQHRSGPAPDVDGKAIESATSSEKHPHPPPTMDQTIFIRHHKVKLRYWMGMKVSAAAGDDDRKGHDRERDMTLEVDPGIDHLYYELDILLDYLLVAQPRATIAVACDEDILELRTKCGEDLANFLRTERPPTVIIDEAVILLGSEPFASKITAKAGDQVQGIGHEGETSRAEPSYTEGSPGVGGALVRKPSRKPSILIGMAPGNKPSHKIYNSALSCHGLGHPMWHPEPRLLPGGIVRPVEIGDVGFFDDSGTFVQIFNSYRPATHMWNKSGVPQDYEPIELAEDLIISTKMLEQSIYKSSHFKERIAPVNSDYHWHPQSSDAILAIYPPSAVMLQAQQLGMIQNYCTKWAHAWYDLSKSLGLAIEDGSLLFVYGTINAGRWAMAVADHGKARQELWLANSFLNGEVSADGPWYGNSPAITTRFGPVPSPTNDEMALDQTVFLRSFKITLRRWLGPKIIRAAASSESFDDPNNDGAACAEVVSAAAGDSGANDIDVLLQYMLEEQPSANLAMASDQELYDLLPNGRVNDFAAFLKERKPLTQLQNGGVVLERIDKYETLGAHVPAYRSEISATRQDPQAPSSTKSASNPMFLDLALLTGIAKRHSAFLRAVVYRQPRSFLSRCLDHKGQEEELTEKGSLSIAY